MLRTFADVAAAHDADVYLRSWSVGVGGVGDLHTSPETYEARARRPRSRAGRRQPGGVDQVRRRRLRLVAAAQPHPADRARRTRLVEIQARREFEGFGAFPDDTTGDHAAALQAAHGQPTPGGRGLGVDAVGRAAAGRADVAVPHHRLSGSCGTCRCGPPPGWPGTPTPTWSSMERTWLRRTWSEDPATVAALSQLLAVSRQAVLDGLYVGPYAEQEVRAFGLEPPPMLWVFKWDLVGGDTATWSARHRGLAADGSTRPSRAATGPWRRSSGCRPSLAGAGRRHLPRPRPARAPGGLPGLRARPVPHPRRLPRGDAARLAVAGHR